MKRKFTKATAMLLSLIFIFTAFTSLPLTANAATEYIDISLVDYPRGGGTDTWGHPALHFMSGWNVSASRLFSAKAASNKGMQVAYCVQPNVPLHPGDQSPEILPETFLDTYNNGALNYLEIQRLLGRIMQYGYTGVVTTSLSDAVMAEMIATQLLVWETIVGERASDFTHIAPPSNLDSITDTIRSDHPLRSDIFANYNRIVTSVQNHSKIPSFMRGSLTAAVTHEMTWDGSKYTVTLTDTNGVLANFNFTSPTPGVSFTKSGNNLTITMTTAPTGEIEIHADKTGSVRSAVTFWCSNKIVVKGEVQGLVMSGQEVSDPINAYVKVKVSYGSLAIVKTTQNNNGSVSGFTFEVRNSAGTLIGTYTTNSTGKIDIPNLQPGTYSVKEINLSSDFVEPTPNPKSVTVNAGQTATVSFDNIKKRGVITIRKTDANPTMGGYSLAGAEFEIRDQGGTLVDTITTDSNGRAQTKILPLGVYRVKETKAPYGFVLDTNTYTSTLSGTQGTGEVVYAPDVTVAEQPQVGRINIEKYNSTPNMGDYDLTPAVFEIRNSAGTLVDTLTTDAQGKAQSKDLKLGDYTVTEKSAPYGYVRNTNTFNVKLEYGGQDVSVVYKTASIPERPQTGIIRVHKLNANPNMGDYPLNGAVFEVRAAQDIKQRDGKVIYNKGDLADTITTNAAGEAQTKELPLGAYPLVFTAHESAATARPVFITQDEVDKAIIGGGNVVDHKFRVYSFFLQGHTAKEKADFLKHEHGTSGSYSGDFNKSYDSNGFLFSRGSISTPYDKVLLPWSKVAKRIDEYIADGRYMSQRELDHIPEYEKGILAWGIYHFYQNQPEEVPRPYPSAIYDVNDAEKVIRPQLDEPERVAEILEGMAAVLDNTADFDRHYESMRKFFEDLTAYHNGAFSLFAPAKPAEKEIPIPPLDLPEPSAAPVNEAAVYDLQLGATVFIGTDEYELYSFDDTHVVLRDVNAPLFTKDMPRDEFDRKLRENHLNDDLIKTADTPDPKTPEPEIDENAELKDQIRDRLDWLGYMVSDELIEDGLEEYGNRGGDGDYKDVADFIERVFLSEDETPKQEEGQPYIPKVGDKYEIEGRMFIVDTVDPGIDKVSLRDVTFENGVGFPIFRSETLAFMEMYDPIQPEPQTPAREEPAEKETITPSWEQTKRRSRTQTFDLHPEIPMSERHNYRITDDDLGVGGAKTKLQHFDAWASTFGETVTAIELAPEGTGYRAKTRFAKFYNLPELMSMFKMTANIQTADMLNLPVPKANFHNEVIKPSQWQQDMVALLSSIAIRERKYEIGVLRAMGMQKLKVIAGLWTETLAITIICLMIGLGVGTLVAQPVSNVMLDQQIAAAEQASKNNSGMSGSGMMSSSSGNTGQDTEPLKDLNVSLQWVTILEIIGIALVLSSLSGVIATRKITKYEPIKILMERN